MSNLDDHEELAAKLASKLQPWRIRSTLAFAGLFQLTHELIKDHVVDQVRAFYMTGFGPSGFTYDEPRYAADVLARDPKKRVFRGSLLWLVHSGAISNAQADRLDAIYAHRHELTHELGKFIVDVDVEPDMDLFVDALTILKAIADFWTQIEIDIGTFDDHRPITVQDVTPGTLVILQICIQAYFEGLAPASDAA